MESYSIPYTLVPKTTQLYLDYLYHFDRLARFYSGSPLDVSNYRAVAAQLTLSSDLRAAVADILARQNADYGAGEATLRNIGRLRDTRTMAVVTGQQVGLFSGPAYTIYKALTAVRLAEHLSQLGLAAVPIFWLVTEDHDWEEVAEAAVLDEEYRLTPLRVDSSR